MSRGIEILRWRWTVPQPQAWRPFRIRRRKKIRSQRSRFARPPAGRCNSTYNGKTLGGTLTFTANGKPVTRISRRV